MSREAPRQFLITAAAIVVVAALWLLRDLLVLVGLALVLAYALDPIVSLLQKIPFGPRRMPRGLASGAVVLILVLVAGWMLSLGLPRLVQELGHFMQRAPIVAGGALEAVRQWASSRGLGAYADPIAEDLRTNAPQTLRSLGGALGSLVAPVFGGLGQLFGFLLVPLLSYYLLAERDDVRESVLRFLPEHARQVLPRIEGALDRALRSYVRGQATVCAAMAVTVGTALASMGYPYALLLAVIVGLAEVLPVIGAFVASAAILFVGLSVSPGFALLGTGAYVVINWAVGALVTPRLMGHHLKMHPFLVTVSVLAGAGLMGAGGAMLALPGAAAAQALVEEFAGRRTPGSTKGETARPRETS
jgi:predicted PurR-regulated permease PerM